MIIMDNIITKAAEPTNWGNFIVWNIRDTDYDGKEARLFLDPEDLNNFFSVNIIVAEPLMK